MRTRPALLLATLSVLCAASAPTSAQHRVKDVLPDGERLMHTPNLTALGDRVFFTGPYVEGVGNELWVSDGTSEGTFMVEDILPGEVPGSSSPGRVTAMGGAVYFHADDGVHGHELWRSDGTEGGTRLVRDIWPGVRSSGPHYLTAVGDRLFFWAALPETGSELWVSDGTEAGTRLVKDIHPGEGRSLFSAHPWPVPVAVGDRLFFTADDGASGPELWTSDGTETGTYLVQELAFDEDEVPHGLRRVGDSVFFFVGRRLYVSDGSSSGTRLVHTLASPVSTSHLGVVEMGGELYFLARVESDDWLRVWVSDGTPEGTRPLSTPYDGSSAPRVLTATDDHVFFDFRITDLAAEPRFEFWVTDGTSEGTARVATPPSLTQISALSRLGVDETLYFVAADTLNGGELWRASAASGRAQLVGEITPGHRNAPPDELTLAGTRLFFWAAEVLHENGFDLWAVTVRGVPGTFPAPALDGEREFPSADPPYVEIDLDAGEGAVIEQVNFVEADRALPSLDGLAASLVSGDLAAVNGDWRWRREGDGQRTATFRLTAEAGGSQGRAPRLGLDYAVEVRNSFGEILYLDSSAGAVAAEPDGAPEAVALELDGPNPFTDRTALRFALPTAATVDLRVYDVAGRLVRTLVEREPRPAGEHTVDLDGRGLAGGVYLVRLRAGDRTATQRLAVVR